MNIIAVINVTELKLQTYTLMNQQIYVMHVLKLNFIKINYIVTVIQLKIYHNLRDHI